MQRECFMFDVRNNNDLFPNIFGFLFPIYLDNFYQSKASIKIIFLKMCIVNFLKHKYIINHIEYYIEIPFINGILHSF